jgi:hypothetical protein
VTERNCRCTARRFELSSTAGHIEKMLKPFTQAGTNAQITQEGVGLSIAKGLIAARAGTFTLTSQLGQGTTVRLTFLRVPEGVGGSGDGSCLFNPRAAGAQGRFQVVEQFK